MATVKQKAAMETRLLLWLWFAEQSKKTVTRAQAVSKLKRKREAAADYRQVLQGLADAGAIVVDAKNYCTITSAGESQLDQGLLERTFGLPGTIVGAWVANALLAWMRRPGQAVVAPSQEQSVATKIESQIAVDSYEAFSEVALETYEALNQGYNLDDLVPIYRIRREIGDRVTRSEFDQWLLEMQSEDVVQLIGGEMPELTPEKAEDSIQTRVGTTRYYVKRLDA